MGSSNSGNLTDYSGRPKSSTDDGDSGGASGSDRCGEAFSVALEDVAMHQYFVTNADVPPAGEILNIELDKRVVAKLNGVSVGSLPTKFNYLAACLRAGFTYNGVVVASSAGTNPQVQADFAPT